MERKVVMLKLSIIRGGRRMMCSTIIKCRNCGEMRVYDGDMRCLFCEQGVGFDEYKALIFSNDEKELLNKCLKLEEVGR
jgi:hypothetical protein